MSFQAIDPVARMEQELHKARTVNTSLAIWITAAKEYWGEFPPALDKRLEIVINVQTSKRPPPSLERILEDVRAVVRDYKEQTDDAA